MNLERTIVECGEKQHTEKLRTVISQAPTEELLALIDAKLGRKDFSVFWVYLLEGFDLSTADGCAKRLVCVKACLSGLQKAELGHKRVADVIMRICQDITSYPNDQLISLLENCVDCIRTADSKFVSLKDMIPKILVVLERQPQLNVNDIVMSGYEYRNTIFRNICAMPWLNTVLIPLADMFKELVLSNNELQTVLIKFAGKIQQLEPTELPALAYQMFHMCNQAAHIIIPILAIDHYYHSLYYKKLFSDLYSSATDVDSIDQYSEKEMRESEETVLHHLMTCTLYKISEAQMAAVLKNFLYMPDIVLRPFFLSAVLCMSSANKDPDHTDLASSPLLCFLRNVLKHNAEESKLADGSVWYRDALQSKRVNMDEIFLVLIDRNKEGKDIITPGLVNLAFALLKTKNSAELNTMAIGFLTKFIRKRFVFGKGIVKRVADWLVVEQNQTQYSECLTMLSIADTFTVSECTKTINYVMDFFLWVPLETAMRMVSFILPLLKISNVIRDSLIEVLRKALYSTDVKKKHFGVYGFCMILKQLNNSNARRSQMNVSSYCTQRSISNFSLITQSTLGSADNPQRNFDMLTLEIIGGLRVCLLQTVEIRCVLYEYLQRAVEINHKLVGHVVQFMDWHFRGLFKVSANDAEEQELVINYDKFLKSTDPEHNTVLLYENIGHLTQFMAHCSLIHDEVNAEYDTFELKRLLNLAMEHSCNGSLKFSDVNVSTTFLNIVRLHQQINFVEALMSFALISSKQRNNLITNVLPLFKLHTRLRQAYGSLTGKPKKALKQKNADAAKTLTEVFTLNDVPVKKIPTTVENIWELAVLEKFLRLTQENSVDFASTEHVNPLRSNVEFVRYVLEICTNRIEGIRLAPEYKQLSHSKRVLKILTGITKVVYERCIRRLPEVWKDYDVKAATLAAQCYYQCLSTANTTYKAHFQKEFVKGYDLYAYNKCKEAPYVVQDMIDKYMEDFNDAPDSLIKESSGVQIPLALLKSLEILYENSTYESRITFESFTWLLAFCRKHELQNNELGLVHKLLFKQRQKTHSGAFFNQIAQALTNLLGRVTDEDEEEDDSHAAAREDGFKSITRGSASSCLQELYAALSRQIQEVEYFINKANNVSYRSRVTPTDERTFNLAHLEGYIRRACAHLINVATVLQELTNACIPLGACMDSLLRLLIQYYTCMKNLARHYLMSADIEISYIKSTRFDVLLHAMGKKLPTNVYALILYIESNVLDDDSAATRKKLNPMAAKAKVLRETKLIPKVILCIENFNKHVVQLGKKTDSRISNYLHFGKVRDFRIKTADLKEAIERTFTHSSQIDVDISGSEEVEIDDEDEPDVDATTGISEGQATGEGVEQINTESTIYDPLEEELARIHGQEAAVKSGKTKKSKQQQPKTKKKDVQQFLSDEEVGENQSGGDKIEPEMSRCSEERLLKNLSVINLNARKRALDQSEEDETNIVPLPPPAPPKRKRGRTSKNKN